MKQKYLALALSAIFATALAGCGSNDNDAPYLPPVTPDLPTDPETPEPEVPGDGNEDDNVGDAAEGNLNLKTDTTVGTQQYVRGPNAKFDRELNSNLSNNGNESVRNSKTLQNEKLDNILVGRETVERKGQQDPDVALRLAGEAVNGFSQNTPNQTWTLQEYNANGGTSPVTRTTPNFTVGGTYTYFDNEGKTVQENGANLAFDFDPALVAAGQAAVTTTPNSYPLYKADGTPLLDSANERVYLAGTTTAATPVSGNQIQVNNDLTTAGTGVIAAGTQQEAGLVSVILDTVNGIYDVKGQEDLAGARNNVTVDGSTKSTRIFGKNYRDTNNSASTNSYRFTKGLNKDNVYENVTAADLQEIKLNHVQYGRVTSNIDKLQPSATIGKDGTIYYQSEIQDKNNTADNNGVDTYFYRGTGETSTGKMSAFFDNKDNITAGTVSYAGHAVMYGIDNSYHGNKGNPDTNAPGNAEIPTGAIGNLVQANVDIADRTIAGSVFNVWQLDNGTTNGVTRKDDLVTFKGDIFGNSAKGESQLAYGSKDKGAFKGSFFGDNAQEFGGSVNSIDKGGYGKAAWGGVFGTQRVDQVIEDGNANQTE